MPYRGDFENCVILECLRYIENYASGLTRIFDEYKNEENLPIVDSSLIGFKVTLSNKNYEVFKEINAKPWLTERVTEKVTEKEAEILNLLAMNPEYTHHNMAEKIGVSRKTISSRIKSLKEKGVIERVGSDTKGYWKINKG